MLQPFTKIARQDLMQDQLQLKLSFMRPGRALTTTLAASADDAVIDVVLLVCRSGVAMGSGSALRGLQMKHVCSKMVQH
jgi:hypothetical protein